MRGFPASAVALAVDLGLHIGSEGEPSILEKRRLTWHSIVIIDTSLALQLGRVPLTPAGHTVPFPHTVGSDEWEMQRSENVHTLQAYYMSSADAESAAAPAEGTYLAGAGAFGSSCPARTLSTFVLASNIAQCSHAALTAINSPHSSNDDATTLMHARTALDSLMGDFSEFYMPDASGLQHTAQSKVDLFLRWSVIRIFIEQILAPQTVLSSCASVTRILQHKLQSFSWFRTPMPTSMVCLFFGAMSLPDTGQRPACRAARQQLRKIFPQLLDRLESMSYLPIDFPENLRSTSIALAMEKHGGSAARQDQQVSHDDSAAGHSLNFLLNAAASVFDAQPAQPSENVNANGGISGFSGLSESVPHPNNAHQYSLPHQAMQSLADLFEKTDEVTAPGNLEASRIFDSASWYFSRCASCRPVTDVDTLVGLKRTCCLLWDSSRRPTQVRRPHQTSFPVLRVYWTDGIMAMVITNFSEGHGARVMCCCLRTIPACARCAVIGKIIAASHYTSPIAFEAMRYNTADWTNTVRSYTRTAEETGQATSAGQWQWAAVGRRCGYGGHCAAWLSKDHALSWHARRLSSLCLQVLGCQFLAQASRTQATYRQE